MRYARASSCILLGTALIVAGCDKKTPVAPDDASSLSLSSVTQSSYDLTATASGFTAISLTWRDISSNETGYEIHRSTSGAGGTFSLLTTTSANVTSTTDLSVAPSSQYCYRVRSFKRSRSKTTYASFSSVACATTPTPPPSNVNATPATSSAIDITWTDNAPTDDTFRIERAPSPAGPWEIAVTTSSQTSFRDASRTAETALCYRVIAVHANGDSAPSSADCTAPPAGPTDLSATAGRETIDLAWSDNSAVEDGYEVQFSDDGVTFHTLVRLTANVRQATHYRPSTNTTFWYRVRALKDGGFSDLSNVVSAIRTCGDAPERVCDNAVDDDCDGFVDFADPDCTNCQGGVEVDCTDYADNDCDGLVDGADPDCPAPECDWGCPPGMVCLGDGRCYYPWW